MCLRSAQGQAWTSNICNSNLMQPFLDQIIFALDMIPAPTIQIYYIFENIFRSETGVHPNRWYFIKAYFKIFKNKNLFSIFWWSILKKLHDLKRCGIFRIKSKMQIRSGLVDSDQIWIWLNEICWNIFMFKCILTLVMRCLTTSLVTFIC